jgi:hypothetical protein
VRSSHQRLFRVIVLGGFGLVSPGACGHRKPLAGADAGVSTGQGGAGGVIGGAGGVPGTGGATTVDAGRDQGTGGFPMEGPNPCYAQPPVYPCDAAAGGDTGAGTDARVDHGFPLEGPQ